MRARAFAGMGAYVVKLYSGSGLQALPKIQAPVGSDNLKRCCFGSRKKSSFCEMSLRNLRLVMVNTLTQFGLASPKSRLATSFEIRFFPILIYSSEIRKKGPFSTKPKRRAKIH
jgi:hypothetical protein